MGIKANVSWTQAQTTIPSPSSPVAITLGIRGDDFPKVAKILEPLSARNRKLTIVPLDIPNRWTAALVNKKVDFVATNLSSVLQIADFGARKQLRIAAILQVEHVHIASRKDVGGVHIRDLRGRRASQGPPQSSTEFDSSTAFGTVSLRCRVSVNCTNADFEYQPRMLAGKEVDVFFVTDRAPTPTVVEAGKVVNLRLLIIDPPIVTEMNKALGKEYYSPGLLELAQYTGNSQDRNRFISTASIVYATTNARDAADPELTSLLL